MFKKIISSFFTTLCVLTFIENTYSQKTNSIENSYLEYFKLPRESIFIHTNKTTFLTNEDIWFKAYTLDRKNNFVSKKTTNIYLGLYNNLGIQIDKKLYLAKNGMASGNFSFDPELASGEYYIKASTNWMKNFKEDDSFVQKIYIINGIKKEQIKKKIKKEYDFQLLPEGGNILEGVKNTIGFKALDDTGKGIFSSGNVLNSKKEIITSFKSNSLGIGKFSFTPKKNENYYVKVKINNGKSFTKGFPTIEKKGIALILNNLNKENVVLNFSTNNSSFEILKNKDYKILITKDGNIKSIPLIFNKKLKQISIPKKKLFYGTNTLTLFNEVGNPVLERLFFNNSKDINSTKISLNFLEEYADSLTYIINSDSTSKILNASISILPEETKSYLPEHNISSTFHLKPYVKGEIENPKYYFKKFNRKKTYELDILLITQGWSRYSWDDIFHSQPKPIFDFENGISANGHINTSLDKIKSLFLHPTIHNKSLFINVDDKGKFNLKNFYPLTNENIYFSYVDKKGKMKKPGMYLSYIILQDKDKISISNYSGHLSYYNKNKTVIDNFILDESFEELDEVYIKSDIKKRLRQETRDPILVNGKVTKITDDEINRYPNVVDFIQNNGYDVNIINGFTEPGRTGLKLGDVVITSRGRGGQDGNAAPTIFLDNILLRDFNVLLNLETDEIDRIVVDKTGIGLGLSGGFGGAIKIFRRRGLRPSKRNNKPNNTSYVSRVNFGFEPEKEFYSPKYISEQTRSFDNYGVIYWNPNLKISQNDDQLIKFIDNKSNSYRVFIEGITSDGKTFSIEQTLKLY